jgi:hypothetical protein
MRSEQEHGRQMNRGIESLVEKVFMTLPDRMKSEESLLYAGRRLNVRCLLGTRTSPLLVSITNGMIVDITPAPRIMPSWQFSFRASGRAWIEYWKPMPKPGWHDILALLKIREADLDGDLTLFMSHLQYFKDLLALPRGQVEATS